MGLALAVAGATLWRVRGQPEPSATDSSVVRKGPRVAPELLHKAGWWHEDWVEAQLQLTDRQRTELDTVLDRFLERFAAASAAQEVAAEALSVALRSGELEAAAKAGDQRAKARATLATLHGELVLDGLAVLDDTQLRLLASNRPHLLRSRWYREVPIGHGGRARSDGDEPPLSSAEPAPPAGATLEDRP